MDILKLLKKILRWKKANDNIIQLINTIIGYEECDIRVNCPKQKFYGEFDCPYNENGKKVSCGECKEIYLY